MDAADLPDDKPLSLKLVCELIFDDLMNVASLMIEHSRGNLQISKIGHVNFTTPADLKELFRKCRAEANTRYFGAIREEERRRVFDEAALMLAPPKMKEPEKGPISMAERMSLADRKRRYELLSVPARRRNSTVTDGVKTIGLSELPDDLPLSLKEVCERIFGDSISVSSLMVEHERGNLKISKIGRTHFTTPADLRAMYVKCRVAITPHVPFPKKSGR